MAPARSGSRSAGSGVDSPESVPDRWRIVRAILLIAGAIVLAILIAHVGAGTILALMRRVGWGFALVTLLYAFHLSVRATALWRSLPAGSLALGEVVRIRFAAEAIEMLTFTGPFFAEPAKGWLLARGGARAPDAFGAVAVEYLLYTLTSAWLAAAALGLLLHRGVLPELHDGIVVVLVILAAFTAAFGVAAVAGVGLIVPVVRAAGPLVGRGRVERAVARLEPVERVIVDFISARPDRLVEVLAIECAAQALLVLEIAAVMRILALDSTWLDAALVEGGVKFVSVAFFFVPGQLGAQESVYTILFRALGLPAAAGLTLSLVRRIRGLAVAGAGTIALALT